MPSGYSGTPLAKKLGITAGMRFAVVGAPDGYLAWLDGLPPTAQIVSRMPKSPEAVHVFTVARSDLERILRRLRTTIAPSSFVWVSWPKKSSGVPTDITEDVIRDVALPLDFVDVKVCAVTDTWSGLKLVIRKSARPR